jgi:hypothetical protein
VPFLIASSRFVRRWLPAQRLKTVAPNVVSFSGQPKREPFRKRPVFPCVADEKLKSMTGNSSCLSALQKSGESLQFVLCGVAMVDEKA